MLLLLLNAAAVYVEPVVYYEEYRLSAPDNAIERFDVSSVADEEFDP